MDKISGVSAKKHLREFNKQLRKELIKGIGKMKSEDAKKEFKLHFKMFESYFKPGSYFRPKKDFDKLLQGKKWDLDSFRKLSSGVKSKFPKTRGGKKVDPVLGITEPEAEKVTGMKSKKKEPKKEEKKEPKKEEKKEPKKEEKKEPKKEPKKEEKKEPKKEEKKELTKEEKRDDMEENYNPIDISISQMRGIMGKTKYEAYEKILKSNRHPTIHIMPIIRAFIPIDYTANLFKKIGVMDTLISYSNFVKKTTSKPTFYPQSSGEIEGKGLPLGKIMKPLRDAIVKHEREEIDDEDKDVPSTFGEINDTKYLSKVRQEILNISKKLKSDTFKKENMKKEGFAEIQKQLVKINDDKTAIFSKPEVQKLLLKPQNVKIAKQLLKDKKKDDKLIQELMDFLMEIELEFGTFNRI